MEGKRPPPPPHARCHTAKSTIPMPCLNFLFLGHLRLFLRTNLEAKMEKKVIRKKLCWGIFLI